MCFYFQEKRKMTIKDAENEWLNQQRNKKFDSLDLIETAYHSSEVIISDGVAENCDQKHSNPIDSGFSSSTNKSGHSDYAEKQPFSENSNGDFNKNPPLNAALTYQNYLQQLQTHSINGNNNKINAKLKIASMRNSNFSQSKSLSNVAANSLSSSSSSSLLSSNEKENEFKDFKTLSNEDYNYVQRCTNNSHSNSRSNSATGFQRNNQLTKLTPASSSAPKPPTTSTSQNTASTLPSISNPSTSSVQQVEVAPNIKKSVSLNGGSNVHEENIMFFYGIKSLDILDMKLDPAIINQVLTISFHYIDYDEHLSKNFAKIRNKFTNVNVSALC